MRLVSERHRRVAREKPWVRWMNLGLLILFIAVWGSELATGEIKGWMAIIAVLTLALLLYVDSRCFRRAPAGQRHAQGGRNRNQVIE